VGARFVVVVAALVAAIALPPLYLHNTAGAALYNGDEAIYAEMAREMVEARSPGLMRFDGQPYFPRPPAAFWPIAAIYAVSGDSPPEPAVRYSNAILSALAVALTILLGARLFGPLAGVTAGALLATADLYAGYARVYESEPLLLCFVLLSLGGWSMRSRLGWILFGIGLGGALMTKQLVGFLPLGVVAADAICARRRHEPTPSLRGPLLGSAIALLLALPWHLTMLVRYGAVFTRPFFGNAIGHGGGVLLHRTGPWFYLRELGRSEGWPFAVLFLAAAICALIHGLRRGRTGHALVGGWALATLFTYSIARSRYDYYLLLAYPAFTLAIGAFLIHLRRFAVPLALALVLASALIHLPRNLAPLHGDEDARALLADPPVRAVAIYTFGVHPYTARIYGRAPVHVFVENERDLEAAQQLQATGMPAPALLASPPSAAYERMQRPAVLIYPRARAELFDGGETFTKGRLVRRDVP
jgi:4-amino-4-deoxy-L-arabinose transferase-like glycosyltransferase